jgi:hypothetical protein
LDPLTVHDFCQIIDKAIDNFKGLRRGRASLLKRQPIQSLQHRLNIIFSEELLSEFLCISLSLVPVTILQVWAHLVALA